MATRSAAYLLRADSIFQPSSIQETVCVTELPASQQVPAAYISCFLLGHGSVCLFSIRQRQVFSGKNITCGNWFLESLPDHLADPIKG